MKSADIFSQLSQKSVKIEHYFPIYDALFDKYIGKDITIVEIGVLNGGSLLLWRQLFGPRARIIGIDLDEHAVAMRSKGFEIVIGDQSSPAFWDKFYQDIGAIDILLDDGGHTNLQQIVTLSKSLHHIKDGGLILTEDTITSYLPQHGNPSRYSFINYAKLIVDQLHLQSKAIWSVQFFNSIVAIHVDRRLCGDTNIVSAGCDEIGAVNHWRAQKRLISFEHGKTIHTMLAVIPQWLADTIIKVYRFVDLCILKMRFKLEHYGLRRYFVQMPALKNRRSP